MRIVTSTLLLLLYCFPVYCQEARLTNIQTEQKSETIKICFDHNSNAINLDISQNRESLLNFSNLIKKLSKDTLSVVSKIEINSYASPEGGRIYNEKLTDMRSNAIYDYLTNVISVPDSLIDTKHSGTNWKRLNELVEESDMPYKDEVLYILRNVPEETWRRVNPNDRWLSMVDSRNKHLMELKYGEPYRYMFENIYPELRHGSVVAIYTKQELPPVIEHKEEIIPEEIPECDIKPEPIVETITEPERIIKPLFAIKTNLLYDAATVLNVEVEVPIGKRWSVAGEWTFPWWKWDNGNEDSPRHRIQMLNTNIEGKYWFGDRENRPQLTGWNLGMYVGGGDYDFEYNSKGYHGEFFVTGLSGGYAHTINKKGNLRMEYTLALGFVKTDYRYYEAMFDVDELWHPIRTRKGNYTWIGPTRARVSLVWLLNYKSKNRR